MAKLDRIDREIVGLLQQNARRSNRDIASKVGIAESTCLSRIRRLEQIGCIEGYHAEINPESVGVGLQAMVSVRLKSHTLAAINAFWDHVVTLTEATGTFHITGQYDFLVHLKVTDANHLRQVTTQVITTWAEVSHLQTSVVFEYRRNHSGFAFISSDR